MNEANYASLEASKRLVDAGIVLETERYFHIFDEEVHDYTAEQKKIWEGEVRRGNASPEAIFIPRPSMAEVWRELPERSYFTKYNGHYQAWSEWTTFEGHGDSSPVKENTNPADALIDLLIWQRKEANHG
jgi:hypothetical protein